MTMRTTTAVTVGGMSMWMMMLLVLIHSCTATVRPTSGCGKVPPVEPGNEKLTRFTINVDGVARSYWMFVGKSYERDKPTALILTHHGWGGDGDLALTVSGWMRVANEHGAVIVAPDGMNDGPSPLLKRRSWNGAGTTQSPGPDGLTCTANENYCYDSCKIRPQGCNKCDWTSCHDDVAFVEAMIDVLQDQVCIDESRVFTSGFSNGGQFQYELARKLAHKFSAFAPGGGHPHNGFNYPPDVGRGERISVINIHGRDDTVCPPLGGLSRDGWYYIDIREALPVWSSVLKCGTGPEKVFPTPYDRMQGLECWSVGSCDDVAVVRCLFDGAHTWPEIAAELQWWFFHKYPQDGDRAVRPKTYTSVTKPVRVTAGSANLLSHRNISIA